MSLRYEEPAAGPDIQLVATDPVGSPAEHVELYKVTFGAEAEALRVEKQQPLPSADYHGGAVRFDSGRQAVAAGAAALVGPAGDSWLDAILLINVTDQVQPFALTDGADNAYGGRSLEPKELRSVPLFGFLFAGGVKVGAENAGAVFVQFKGTR